MESRYRNYSHENLPQLTGYKLLDKAGRVYTLNSMNIAGPQGIFEFFQKN